MKFLLVALNAKYIHSNLAIYCLKAYSPQYREQIELAEYTINHRLDDIIGDIYRRKPDCIGFSAYIWNIDMLEEIASEIHKVLPKTKIWFGGPEVSYDAKSMLAKYPFIDGVMVGEGEETFSELMDYYAKNQGTLKDVGGLTFRSLAVREDEIANYDESEIYETKMRPLMDLSKVPFVYDDLDKFKNKIVYYESSRGCPYSCSYCLSSIDKSVRFRDIELVKKELQIFLDHKIPQVKFIDRTFNCKHEHSMAIWTYLKEHDNGITNFHFEISADILREDELELLNTLREGLVQLEIGVQSTNPKTIEAIHRKMDLKKLAHAVDRVHEGKNIHQHLDLIAGLPYEDYDTFAKSFDDVYQFRPNQLQLGFLKVLKGSHMHDVSEKYQIVYKSKAPYEVLYTNWLSYDEVLQLKQIEDMVEVYYNSCQFTYSIEYLVKLFDRPFHLFKALADYYEKHDLNQSNHARIKRYEYLLDFYMEQEFEHVEAFKELLTFDLYLREKMKSRPSFTREENINTKRVLKDTDYANCKMVHIEHFTIDPEKTSTQSEPVYKEHYLLFNYDKRSPLDHSATRIDLGMISSETK
ncbi:Fe-S oxidoreductase [Lachnospiraceae bacterium KM106-2]|nr:Fe-S oxidoreductase [Lachnospiraceae bacterium KM106-2]